jgi:hypothetical protein
MPKPNSDHTPRSPLCEIEYILKKRTSKKGIDYLIKWKGFPENKATW